MSTISIIIATYNAEKHLQKCIDSIVSQDKKMTELIIIDGNSRDNTLNVIKDNEEHINYWVSEPDMGIYDAWNKGINKASGEWMLFIGADDVLIKSSLKHYFNVINSIDAKCYDYISARNQYVDVDGKLIKVFGAPADWNGMRYKMTAAHVASLHNRKLFEEIGGYKISYKICADYELLLRKREELKHLFVPFEIARMQVGGTSFTSKALLETFKIRKQHRTVSRVMNNFLLLRNYFEFYFFILRKSLMGFKLK